MNKSVVAAVLLLVAGAFAVGSYVFSNRIDRDAAQHGSSTRGTDPNAIQEQGSGAARGPSTSGSKTQGGVPPASR